MEPDKYIKEIIQDIWQRNYCIHTREKRQTLLIFLSNNCESKPFSKCVSAYIDYIYHALCSIPDYRQQILLSDKYFGTLRDLPLANDFYTIFLQEVAIKIFDIFLIKDSQNSCVKKALLEVFIDCTKVCDKSVRYDIIKRFPDFMSRIVNNISNYGDYVLQVALVELLFRMYGKKRILSSLKKLMPESQTIFEHIANIHAESFEEDIRIFLNDINKHSGNIFSISCRMVKLGNIVCGKTIDTSDDLWVDFNLCDGIISWFCTLNDITDDKFCWHLITLLKVDVNTVTVSSEINCPFLMVYFYLKRPCIVDPAIQSIINKNTVLLLSVENKQPGITLINNILPNFFGNRFMNTRVERTEVLNNSRHGYKSLNIKVSKPKSVENKELTCIKQSKPTVTSNRTNNRFSDNQHLLVNKDRVENNDVFHTKQNTSKLTEIQNFENARNTLTDTSDYEKTFNMLFQETKNTEGDQQRPKALIGAKYLNSSELLEILVESQTGDDKENAELKENDQEKAVDETFSKSSKKINKTKTDWQQNKSFINEKSELKETSRNTFEQTVFDDKLNKVNKIDLIFENGDNEIIPDKSSNIIIKNNGIMTEDGTNEMGKDEGNKQAKITLKEFPSISMERNISENELKKVNSVLIDNDQHNILYNCSTILSKNTKTNRGREEKEISMDQIKKVQEKNESQRDKADIKMCTNQTKGESEGHNISKNQSNINESNQFLNKSLSSTITSAGKKRKLYDPNDLTFLRTLQSLNESMEATIMNKKSRKDITAIEELKEPDMNSNTENSSTKIVSQNAILGSENVQSTPLKNKTNILDESVEIKRKVISNNKQNETKLNGNKILNNKKTNDWNASFYENDENHTKTIQDTSNLTSDGASNSQKKSFENLTSAKEKNSKLKDKKINIISNILVKPSTVPEIDQHGNHWHCEGLDIHHSQNKSNLMSKVQETAIVDGDVSTMCMISSNSHHLLGYGHKSLNIIASKPKSMKKKENTSVAKTHLKQRESTVKKNKTNNRSLNSQYGKKTEALKVNKNKEHKKTKSDKTKTTNKNPPKCIKTVGELKDPKTHSNTKNLGTKKNSRNVKCTSKKIKSTTKKNNTSNESAKIKRTIKSTTTSNKQHNKSKMDCYDKYGNKNFSIKKATNWNVSFYENNEKNKSMFAETLESFQEKLGHKSFTNKMLNRTVTTKDRRTSTSPSSRPSSSQKKSSKGLALTEEKKSKQTDKKVNLIPNIVVKLPTVTEFDQSDKHLHLENLDIYHNRNEIDLISRVQHATLNNGNVASMCRIASDSRLLVSKPAPYWKSIAVMNGKSIHLKSTDFLGKYLIFFFYPMDFGPESLTDIQTFNSQIDEFRKLETNVIGCSIDSHFAHLAWTNLPRIEGGLGNIDIPLLSDVNHCIAKNYTVLREDLGYSLRSLFIIDERGIIRHASINDSCVNINIDDILRLVQTLQNGRPLEECLI